MKQPSDDLPDWENQRIKIIGLGESSIRKSYYPELQQRLIELERKNEELQATNEELIATEEELRQQYLELQLSQRTLDQARKKLKLLNIVTFEDIQNAVFSLSGYLELSSELVSEDGNKQYLSDEITLTKKITHALAFAKNYQDLGINPPQWQNLNQVFLFAISHLDLSHIQRELSLDAIEIYADALLEKVFYNLMDNVLKHGKAVTKISIHQEIREDDLLIFIEDNGPGIPDGEKEKIFSRGYGEYRGMGLFLSREILSITGISIRESGVWGLGARFEIAIPGDRFRIRSEDLI